MHDRSDQHDERVELRLVWSTITGESRVHEAAPLVNNGAMFVSTLNGQVIASDAKTGDVLWQYRKPRPQGAVILHDVSRGVALYGVAHLCVA